MSLIDRNPELSAAEYGKHASGNTASSMGRREPLRAGSYGVTVRVKGNVSVYFVCRPGFPQYSSLVPVSFCDSPIQKAQRRENVALLAWKYRGLVGPTKDPSPYW